ncbi:hypothetical protein HZA44_01070 [Candidatus Peregrinibacteria bacterium]|nr:hypothetical protein [Candidatus Peregrinibacteria bacterium]
MSNTSLKTAAVAVALLVLTGCNLPFLNKASKVIEEKAGKAIGQALTETGDNGSDNQNNNEQTPPEDSGNNGGSDNGNSNKTDVEQCLKGCGYLNGTGMFSKEFCVDSCWAAVAKDTGDVSICDTKVDPKNDLVQAACRINVAETTLDPKSCAGIGATADDMMRVSCVSNVATKKKDPSICELIPEGMFRSVCLDDVKNAE